VFFYLLATQVLRNAPTWIEILLVETPAFIYFMTFTYFVLLWVVVNRAKVGGIENLRKK